MRRFWYYGASSAGATLLLDLYPATAAYSLRKLRTAYAGAAIRVRRSSDNVEQDIAFIGNDLDTASLLTFVGANDGFVVTWYDQQGSNNLTQGTMSFQPQIVASGVTIVRGGLPAVKFDGSNDIIQNFSSAFLGTVSMSYFSVNSNDVSLGVGTIHSQNSVTNNSIRTFNDRRTVGKTCLVVSNTSSTGFFADMSTFRNDANPRLLSSFIDASKNMSAFDNGATGTTAIYTGTTNNNGLKLGSQVGVTFLNGTIQEFVAFNTDESANRTAIETNINDYYAIY